VAFGLKVENFRNTVTMKDVMASFDSAIKAKMLHDFEDVAKRNVGVGTASENSFEDF